MKRFRYELVFTVEDPETVKNIIMPVPMVPASQTMTIEATTLTEVKEPRTAARKGRAKK